MRKYKNLAPGYMLIFRRWITDKNGNKVFPKNGRAFPMMVPIGSER